MVVKHIVKLSIFLTAVTVLSGCQKSSPPATSDSIEVVIGSAAPLTGPQSHLGQDNANGAQLAIDDANQEHIVIQGKKVHFSLQSEDDAADPKTGTIVAQKFADQKVNGVVGHLNSGTTIPASRIYSNAGIVQISPSATNPKYTQQGFKTAFRVMANDIQQGRVLAQFTSQHLKAKRVAIIDDATSYGQGLADEYAKNLTGVEVVAREHTDDHSTDFSAILTRIKGKSADVIFYGGMDAQSGPMVKQLRALRDKAVFLTGDGGCSTEFAQLAGDAANASFCSLPGIPLDKMPKGPDFSSRFKTKFGPIQDYAPYAYDAVGVMIAAMQQAQSTDPGEYIKALSTLHYNGVTANISFDEKGDLKDAKVTVYEWLQGKKTPVEN
ncbi:MAG: branched chain amino acid ABC transporter substrate-binding protein [Ferrovum sp. 37-45-19]|jgi:branched-chain amino acid transport system substrate-binding protein|uniref:branched-chain amino acid ABC transporter substrate-binding protein n=1 Tax=Ferrovum sp. JA12 TaxID=1356299 RepID=UPI0007024086|nr:branched-chain amino acid ABC transporter substrate-binding protein [Ferrovum sp. JA12]OYV80451.1 MAG: branched chain amino acid ABC transporter substrate-binding protein [Ferrovum sp. 21-44-67]OYV94766.1 MAG: branched chain amino acid ABC transporter substrate-binding protein [Ferrovum sp. 37-45-19]OZB31906.1 MAG: branched chain amino acid ABC transporter substrate-binding protein [Ferrovum sp. 34-44-207]HQT81114.1 branched-chain amino acid ABC transporter substrate-binding protein [Ferrova